MQTGDTTEAASLVDDWLQLYKIDVLYVIGPFATEYPNVDKYVTVIPKNCMKTFEKDNIFYNNR